MSKPIVIMTYPKGAYSLEKAIEVKKQFEDIGFDVVNSPFNNNAPRPPEFRFIDAIGPKLCGVGKASVEVVREVVRPGKRAKGKSK